MQETLGLARPNQVRMIFYEGSSTYGNGYHYLDINDSAALISKLAGAPVRLQLMRWDEQGWTRYGPAIMHDIRAGIDDKGNIVAYEAVGVRAGGAGTTRRAARSLGEVPAAPGSGGTNAENLAPMYKVANAHRGHGYRLISKTQTQAMGMFQNGTLRAPSGPQTTFASEQIIDMLAIAANMDPYTFRVQNMATGPAGPRGEWQRYTGVLTAAHRRGQGGRLRAARLRLEARERQRRARLGHGGRDAQRLVRGDRRSRRGEQEDGQGHRPPPLRRLRTRASRSTPT